jgi:hypothetical protein
MTFQGYIYTYIEEDFNYPYKGIINGNFFFLKKKKDLKKLLCSSKGWASVFAQVLTILSTTLIKPPRC